MADFTFELLHNSNTLVAGFLDKVEVVPESIFDGKHRPASGLAKVRSPGQVVVAQVKFDSSFLEGFQKLVGHFVIIGVSSSVFSGKVYYKALTYPVSLHKSYLENYSPVQVAA